MAKQADTGAKGVVVVGEIGVCKLDESADETSSSVVEADRVMLGSMSNTGAASTVVLAPVG